MNIIAPQFIRDYFLEKFKNNYKMSSGESELIVPSVYVSDDYKRHMSINLDTGLWQCFKSGNKGNFTQLYAYMEGLTYNQAEADILFKEFDGQIESITHTQPKLKEVDTPSPTRLDDLHLKSVTVEDYDSEDPLVQHAWAFLYERKLFDLERNERTYYVSTKGRYEGRLVIPFVENSEIFYFQARALGEQTPKYLNPSDDWPRPSHILYPFDEEADQVVICEGPLDAISLQLQGVNATCTMGCSVSELQVEALKNFDRKIIIGYDNDDAGKRGVGKFDYLRRLKRMADLYICHPPSEDKDWNDAHMRGQDLSGFVDDHTKQYDYDYLMNHLLTTL